MPSYLHPGVYVEEIPSASRPIATASTSIPIFAGSTDRGPIGEPKFILKWGEYVNNFGGIQSETDYMGLSINSYFMNGGGPAYVARLRDGAVASTKILHKTPGTNTAATTLLNFEATSGGDWGNELFLVVANSAADARSFDLDVYLKKGAKFDLVESFSSLGMNANNPKFIGHVLAGNSNYLTAEYHSRLTGTAASLNGVGSATSKTYSDPNAVAAVGEYEMSISVDGGALKTVPVEIEAGKIKLADVVTTLIAALGSDVTVAKHGTDDKIVITSKSKGPKASVVVNGDLAEQLLLTSPNATFSFGESAFIPDDRGTADDVASGLQLDSGSDGSDPNKASFVSLFDGPMMELPKISIVVLPGQDPDNPAQKSIIDVGIAHCEKVKSRMIIVDSPSGTDPTTFTSPYAPSTYAVLYYPWIRVPNSLFDPDKNPSAPPAVLIPPAGAAAGMWAKTDGKRGVWKAPAGVATGLLGIAGTEFEIPDAVQNLLNPLGINCIRNIPRFNYVFWGARTLATNSAPEWRYVPIRRTAIMIERSIYDGIQWAVFEPNDHKLWASLRLNIGNFMDGLFRAGAFQGEKASDAYFVNCGLDDTMTQSDIDNGQVIVEVGFAPLKPAEFVIVRIQQIVGQAR